MGNIVVFVIAGLLVGFLIVGFVVTKDYTERGLIIFGVFVVAGAGGLGTLFVSFLSSDTSAVLAGVEKQVKETYGVDVDLVLSQGVSFKESNIVGAVIAEAQGSLADVEGELFSYVVVMVGENKADLAKRYNGERLEVIKLSTD